LQGFVLVYFDDSLSEKMLKYNRINAFTSPPIDLFPKHINIMEV
jgi:hypothetical protein